MLLASKTLATVGRAISTSTLVSTPHRGFAKKKSSSAMRSQNQQREEYQKQQYAKMQEQLRQKEEQRELRRRQDEQNKIEAQRQSQSHIKAESVVQKTSRNGGEDMDASPFTPPKATSSSSSKMKFNADDFFSAPGKKLARSMDVTSRHTAASGHFKDEKNTQFTPSQASFDKAENNENIKNSEASSKPEMETSEENGLTAQDVIYSLNALVDRDFIDVVSKNRLNKEIMEGARVADRVGSMLFNISNASATGISYTESHARKVFMASLNVVENHPNLIPNFLRVASLESVLDLVKSSSEAIRNVLSDEKRIQNGDEVVETDTTNTVASRALLKPFHVTCRMLSLALLGSIVHGRPQISVAMVNNAHIATLFDLLVELQPTNDPAEMAELNIRAQKEANAIAAAEAAAEGIDATIPDPSNPFALGVTAQASETFLEVERALKIIGNSLPKNSSPLTAALIPELVSVVERALATSTSGFGTMRILALAQSLGTYWEASRDSGALDALADELNSRNVFPVLLDRLEQESEMNSVIYHRLLVLCMKDSEVNLDMFVRGRYSEILNPVFYASHTRSRETKNGLYVSIHIACIRSLLERNPMIKHSLVDGNVFSSLLKTVYDNTAFPAPIDSKTGMPLKALPPDHPYPIMSFPMYLSALDLINLLSYQGNVTERPLPAGIAARTVGVATSILQLSPQHAYAGLRILLALVDQPMARDSFKHLQSMVSVAEANEKYGKEHSPVRFHSFALMANVYSSSTSEFLQETIREDMIPTLVEGVQLSSIDVAVHSLTALGRIVALMETKKKNVRFNDQNRPTLNNSSIPYRRVMIGSGIFDRLLLIIAESNPAKAPDGLKSLTLRFLTNFFCHPPSLHRDILVAEALPLYQKVIQDGSAELANASAVYLETLADCGYFEAIMESDLVPCAVARLGKKIAVPTKTEDGEESFEMKTDFSLVDVYQFVRKTGEALAHNAVENFQAQQAEEKERQSARPPAFAENEEVM